MNQFAIVATAPLGTEMTVEVLPTRDEAYALRDIKAQNFSRWTFDVREVEGIDQ